MSETKESKEKMTKRIKDAYIQSLKNGCTRVKATEAAGVVVSTIWEWTNEDEQFARDIEIALESRVNVVVDALFVNASGGEYTNSKGKKIITKGNVIAQIFYLKNRGQGKWTDKTELEFIAPRIVNRRAFIQAGEEPVIEEEIPEKETLINGDHRVVLKLNELPEKKGIVVQTETNKTVKTVL